MIEGVVDITHGLIRLTPLVCDILGLVFKPYFKFACNKLVVTFTANLNRSSDQSPDIKRVYWIYILLTALTVAYHPMGISILALDPVADDMLGRAMPVWVWGRGKQANEQNGSHFVRLYITSLSISGFRQA